MVPGSVVTAGGVVPGVVPGSVVPDGGVVPGSVVPAGGVVATTQLVCCTCGKKVLSLEKVKKNHPNPWAEASLTCRCFKIPLKGHVKYCKIREVHE